MKTTRFAILVTLAATMLLGGSFAQTTQLPAAVPAGSTSSGYGPYDWLNRGPALTTYKMACFEAQPMSGQDTCLFRDYAGHLSLYGGAGVQLLGQLPYVAGTFDNIPVTATAITTTSFVALAGPLTITSVAVGGVYTGTITGGAANALVGQRFNTAGFTNGVNNVQNVLCTASTATTLTLSATTVAETATATASNDIPLLANTLGVQGKRIRIHADGVYNTGAASLLNVEAMLCQVPGCGSGTIVLPAGCIVTTTNQANVLANGQWNFDCTLTTTATVGAAGTAWAKSMACVQLGAAATAALSCFADLATAASAAFDETKNQFVNIGFKFTTSNAANTATLQSYAVEVLD